MSRFGLLAMTAAAVLWGFYAFTPDVIVLSQSAAPITIPDFQDKEIWKSAKEHIYVHLEDGIPWGMEYFYERVDDSLVMGMELALIWDLDMPVYQVWGPAEVPHQRLFRHGSGWTAPISGAKMEPIPRIDWSGHRAIGATLMVYEGDAARPSAWEVFHDPAVEADDPSPVAKREL